MQIKVHNIETKHGGIYSTAFYINNKIFCNGVYYELRSIFSLSVDVEHHELILQHMRKCNAYVVSRYIYDMANKPKTIVFFAYTNCLYHKMVKAYYRKSTDVDFYGHGLMIHIECGSFCFSSFDIRSKLLRRIIFDVPGLYAIARLWLLLSQFEIGTMSDIFLDLMNMHFILNTHSNLNVRERMVKYLYIDNMILADLHLRPVILLAATVGVNITYKTSDSNYIEVIFSR